jgi:hypothetical protein
MATLQASVNPQPVRSLSTSQRRFGSDYAPQSASYLIYFPITLFVGGSVAWVVPTNATFVLGSLIGALIGLFILLDLLFRDAPLRITTLYGMTILLGYNLGALNSWLTVERAGLTLAERFARDPIVLARAIGACMITAAFLFVVGQIFERPVFGREFRLHFGPATMPLVIISTMLLLGAYATGQAGYMGTTIDSSGHLNPLTALVMWWVIPAFAYSVCAAVNSSGRTRWTLAALCLVQGLAIVPFGRRFFAFALLLAAIASRLGEYRANFHVSKKILIAAGVILLTVAASTAFLYLRVAGYGQKGKTSMRMRLDLAVELAQRRSPMELLGVLGSDASTRTFIIAFFSDLLDASQRSTPLLGRDMLYNLQLAVPSVISSDKFGIVPYNEETLANIHWGFSYIDEANSLLTAGAADFGIIGVLLYPLALLLMVRAAIEWFQYATPTYFAVIVTMGFVFEALQAEEVPVGYFIQLRNALLIALIFYIVDNLPKFRLRPSA